MGGLAQRYVALFWPAIAKAHGYTEDVEPTFLTYEVAQYFMARLATPLIEEGYFADLTLTRPRLYSQLLDNLNKIANNGLNLDDLEVYLGAALNQKDDGARRIKDISETVRAYREFCKGHNLLDFAMYLELFGATVLEEKSAGAQTSGAEVRSPDLREC